MCGLLRYSLYGTRDAAQKLGRGTGIDAQRSRVDEGNRVPVRVERPHQGGDIVATVHGDDITIGGQRSAVESSSR